VTYERNQEIIYGLFNASVRQIPQQHRSRELLDLSRPSGTRGGRDVRYDFGNRYSRPAIVVDGKVKFV